MTQIEKSIEELVQSYKLKKSQIESEYDSCKAENYEPHDCCMEADVKARMDEIQHAYYELMKLSSGIPSNIINESSESTNLQNLALYDELAKRHTADGGKHPDNYATTEVIRQSIIDRTYKHYCGGGYEHGTTNRIKNCDVVVWFTLGGDAVFQLCVDNSEGDCCVLRNSNAECRFQQRVF